jgi:hypothetical protein
MNTKNIIFGTLALAIVGGGAYFYFKNKKKGSLADTLASSITNTGSGTGSGSGSGTGTGTGANTGTGTTPDKVLDTAPVYNKPLSNEPTQAELEAKAKQITKAKELANKICEAKTQKNLFKNMSNSDFCSKYAYTSTFCWNIADVESQKSDKISNIEKLITSLNNQLALLGYMESNCEISKITI